MAEQRRSRGFTRADALVAGAVCLVLVLLVPVVHAMTREMYIRIGCGSNLGQLGKAMIVYANDYEDELPRAGGRTSIWGAVTNWMSATRYLAFGLDVGGGGGRATINSCFYLLVKYTEATPRLFVCGGDEGTTEFRLSDVPANTLPAGFELIDAWDFGPPATSFKSCSYSYHLLFGSPYPPTLAADPNLALVADRSPWFVSPAGSPMPFSTFVPDLPQFSGNAQTACSGNAIAHGLDGQNVLFLDGRVAFEDRPYCAAEMDNIYTPSDHPDEGSPWGQPPTLASVPSNRKDSLLVHDPNTLPPVIRR